MKNPNYPSLFDDGKDPEALRTIGEVANALDIRQHVLRYWEDQFPMLKPLKRSGGRRYYRPQDVALVETINRLVHQEGYTLRGARQTIEGGNVPPPQPLSEREEMTLKLRAIRKRLSAALKA